MRSAILATLILAPVLAHAQAPTQANGSLQARAEAPKPLAATPENTTAKVRVSTGVTQPRLIGNPHITLSDREFDRQTPAEHIVVVSLDVDKDGAAHDVEMLKSTNKAIDEKVIAAVKDFHFVPAQLDAQAIPVHVNLSIVLEP